MQKILALIAILFCLPALAQDPTPPLPKARPDTTVPASAVASPAEAVAAGRIVPLPRSRPTEKPEPPASESAKPDPASPASPPGDHVAAPEKPSEPRVYQTACPSVLLGRVEAKALPPIADGQCHAQSPLALTGVLANGRIVPVSGGVETDCGVASALPPWIEAVDSYVLARENTRIEEVVVGTSYMCRNVNGAQSGNLSFHGFADALDVVGFKLADGRFVTVEGGWANATSPEGRLLRFAHDAACSQFTTVLGPEANAEHHDHLHVDLGCHGKTCTARICE